MDKNLAVAAFDFLMAVGFAAYGIGCWRGLGKLAKACLLVGCAFFGMIAAANWLCWKGVI